MNREERVNIFRDTLVRAQAYPTPRTKVHRTGQFDTNDYTLKDVTQSFLKIIAENPSAAATPGAFNSLERPAMVYTSKKGSIDALVGVDFRGKRVGVLNFASFRHPGGGVVKGARAQEEDLCRCTTLYPSIEVVKYPLPKDGILYTPDVMILKDEQYRPLTTPIRVDVISCAAVCNRPESGNRKAAAPRPNTAAMKEKIEGIFRLAIHYKIDILVLGAFGCGAYGNDPEVIAGIFKECCDKYKMYFESIVFPLKYDENNQQSIYNYETFCRVLRA